jgi:hypothetical protein
MFSDKTYHCVCHGCGRQHDHVSKFLSVPMSIGVDLPDGRKLALPALGCEECRNSPIKGDDHPIRRAWLHGMTPEARSRATTEVLARVEREGNFWEAR